MTKAIYKLAVVGASARAAAFSAIRAGYEVVAADLFADADLGRVADATRIEEYPAGFVEWLAATDCDAWMYTGALENSPELVDRMAAIRPLAGNNGDVLRGVRDPMQLQAALTEAGLSFPETRATAEGLPLDGSWLCKTYRGSSGSGVWRLDGESALERAQQDDAVFQQFVTGKPAAGLIVVSPQGAELLGVTRQLLGKGRGREWQYTGSLGPLAVSANVAAQLHAIGGVLAKQFRLRGLAGVDLVVAGDRAVVVEVNPRYTASAEIVERLIGTPAIASHMAACFTPAEVDARGPTRGDPLPASRSHYAKSILFARRDAIVAPLFHDWAMTSASIDPMHRVLADIPQPREIIRAGRPLLTVFATGYSAADCQRRLGDRLADVEAHLYRGQ